MGNRGLLRAMDAISRWAAKESGVRFGQVFLAAADVDTQLFQQLAPAYAQLTDRSTLYVSENDQAIGLSSRLHRFSRAGIAPPVTVVSGVDTVNVSKVNLGLLGHGYAAEVRSVIGDMYELIRNNTPPDNRFGLRQIVEADAVHWEFQA